MEKKISLSIDKFLFLQNQILDSLKPANRTELSRLLVVDNAIEECVKSFVETREKSTEDSKWISDENARRDFINTENEKLKKMSEEIKSITIDKDIYNYVYPKIDKFLEEQKLVIFLVNWQTRNWWIFEYKAFNEVATAFDKAETLENS